MSIPPDDRYAGEPGYPAPWATKAPREGLRDTDAARIVSLAPDVCLTPVGSSAVPVPYPIHDLCGHDAGYATTVNMTGQRVMKLSSRTTHVHGDAPGTKRGVVSGTVEDVCEPVGHAAQVRAEGSNLVRHLDRFDMNAGNTQGEAIFCRDQGTYEPPTDTDPVKGSLVAAAAAANPFGTPDVLPEGSYQVAQAATGTMTDAMPGSGSGTANPSQPRTVPRLRQRGGFGRRELMETLQRATGQETISEGEIRRWAQQLRTMANEGGGVTPGARRIPLEGADRVAGMTDRDAAFEEYDGTLRRAQAAARAETLANQNAQDDTSTRVSNRTKICFDLPDGMDRDEFERQLQEQEDTINNMSADDMAYAHWVLGRAGTTARLRRPEVQRQARQAYQANFQLRNPQATPAQVAAHMAGLHATHWLEMIAGGDPASISGMGAGDVNSEIGRQWTRNGRASRLRDEAQKMREEGRASEKMNVELAIC